MNEHITLAGGCFWCVEGVLSRTRGVLKAESGYSNGHHPRPNYESVCSGSTGHAEVVQVTFDPAVLGLTTLLDVFFTVHDATTLNRQGNDVGTQYRSGIYTHTSEQATAVEAYLTALKASAPYAGRTVVTEVAPLANYHPAEAYHQRYFEHNPHAGYCAYVVAPKVAKFQHRFPDLDTGGQG